VAKLDARMAFRPGRAGQGRAGRRSRGLASHPLGGADLTPYRHRAAQLATLLGAGGGGDLGRRLGLVRVGLEALVADLDSVEVVEEEVRRLRDLASELASLAAPAVPDGARLERLRERALAVLRAFAAPGAAPAPSRSPDPTQPPDRRRQRDTGFWRR
jgi:hypothetical protein